MPSRPAISVLIPSYNHGRFLEQTIGSVLSQTCEDFELLILDDGSTDNSWAIIERFAAVDARVRAWQQPNAGLVSTLNRLLDAAQGEFIAQIDSDDMWLPQRLAWGLRDMAENPGLAAAFCSFVRIDADTQLTGGIDQFSLGRRRGAALMQLMAPHNCVCACTAFMRHTALVQAGGFARAGLTLVHDWDRWLRLSMCGELLVTEDLGAMYRVHGNNQSLDAATSARQQIEVADAMGPQVIAHYKLPHEVSMRWLSHQASRAIEIQDWDGAQGRLRLKAQQGGLSEKEKIWLLQCMLLGGQREAAAYLADGLHAHRAQLSADSCDRLDAVRGHLREGTSAQV
jgi:glycosyltransferase involved in cell wall biosynthesis